MGASSTYDSLLMFNDKTPAYDLEVSVLSDVRIGCAASFRTWAVKTSGRSEDHKYTACVSLGLYGALYPHPVPYFDDRSLGVVE
jgi:hypothetical protein